MGMFLQIAMVANLALPVSLTASADITVSRVSLLAGKSRAPVVTIDPVITGKTISKQHYERWQKNRNARIKCGDCKKPLQPFPGD